MPAASKPQPKAKADAQEGIGVKEIADSLGVEPRSLRVFLRKTDRAIGRGKRYGWKSLSDPAVKKIVADFKKAQAEEKSEKDDDS